jgi:16S rRNA (cytosine1402-N4)-methyltransferase
MDTTGGLTARDLVNEWDERDISRVLRELGEERYARQIARAITRARSRGPIETTTELVDVVSAAVPAPARFAGGHPAKRTFQAIRIAVNAELDVLPVAIDAGLAALQPGGRCAVLAYHSGVDRIVKARLRHAATGGWTGPAHLPPPSGVHPTVRLLKAGGWTPPAEEAATNPRSRSARLRAAERLAA